jgi:hypothetical protein
MISLISSFCLSSCSDVQFKTATEGPAFEQILMDRIAQSAEHNLICDGQIAGSGNDGVDRKRASNLDCGD